MPLMRTIKKISQDKELNEILKRRKSSSFSLLYYSLWCSRSKTAIALADEWREREGDETMYLVNSWDLPQSFAAFSITSAPTLVHVKKGKIRVDVEYPKVYSYLTAGRPKTA